MTEETLIEEPGILEETEPEPTQPLEVVSVDELVDRLTTAAEELEAEEPEPAEEAAEPVTPSAVEIVGMDQLLEDVQMIQLTVDHPALETPFEEYTVMEGMLLLLLVLVIVSWCVKMIKGGFSWLLW